MTSATSVLIFWGTGGLGGGRGDRPVLTLKIGCIDNVENSWGGGGGGEGGHSYVHTILTLSVHTPSQYLTVKFIQPNPQNTSVHKPIS